MTTTPHDQSHRPAIEADETYHSRPPRHLRPDRCEVIATVGSGRRESFGDGIEMEWLAGAHNGARNLATGLLTFAPSAGHAPHRHHVEESVTVLQGSVIVEVEDRRYELHHLDNIVIPRGLSRRITNANPRDPAQIHLAFAIAMPTSSPGVCHAAARCGPSRACPGEPGERFNRFATAPRYEAAADVSFIQYFNRDMIPGITMCGGFGRFQPRGRLPAHLHDCDESICIIEGLATCWVEGRRYQVGDYATALQPRGRVHYFVNDTDAPMAMIWVYAAPTAARIVVDERCAVEPGVAWPSTI